jgi:hypothetical protein
MGTGMNLILWFSFGIAKHEIYGAAPVIWAAPDFSRRPSADCPHILSSWSESFVWCLIMPSNAAFHDRPPLSLALPSCAFYMLEPIAI